MAFKNKLAVIIPTKDNKHELQRLLSSLVSQSYVPEQIIIIDASAVANTPNMEGYGVAITYIHKDSGISEARNIGISVLKEDINLVCFLDDDVVMEENSMEAMMAFWECAEVSVGGCSFFITGENQYNKPSMTFLKRLFCMGSISYGKILPSGVNINPYNPSMKITYTDWLSGGVTVWRISVFKEYAFDEWFSGYGSCEDVDFSYRVGKKYKLIVNADARVKHLTDTLKKGKNFQIGKKVVINRLYFVKKHSELSVFLSLWAGVGELMYNLLRGLISLNEQLIVRACGNVTGICEYLILKDRVFRKDRLEDLNNR